MLYIKAFEIVSGILSPFLLLATIIFLAKWLSDVTEAAKEYWEYRVESLKFNRAKWIVKKSEYLSYMDEMRFALYDEVSGKNIEITIDRNRITS